MRHDPETDPNYFLLTRRLLKQAGIENPGLEARIFLREFAGVSDADILTGKIFLPDPDRLRAAIERRAAREPMGRILGYREFWGRKFLLSPETLEPRPDTETLIDVVLATERSPELILDLGTGTGCILLTLLHEYPQAFGMGVDLSFDACKTARANAAAQSIGDRAAFLNGNWADAVQGQFDLIVSNPPYIPSGDIPNLDFGVRKFDPILALNGGRDGLDPYRNLLKTCKNLLAPGGRLIVEIGFGQAEEIGQLIAAEQATQLSITCDLAGVERIIEISFGDKS